MSSHVKVIYNAIEAGTGWEHVVYPDDESVLNPTGGPGATLAPGDRALTSCELQAFMGSLHIFPIQKDMIGVTMGQFCSLCDRGLLHTLLAELRKMKAVELPTSVGASRLEAKAVNDAFPDARSYGHSSLTSKNYLSKFSKDLVALLRAHEVA